MSNCTHPGRLPDLNSDKIIYAKQAQKIVKSLHCYHRKSIINQEGKEKVIPEQVKDIEPEMITNEGLIFTPWKGNFSQVNKY